MPSSACTNKSGRRLEFDGLFRREESLVVLLKIFLVAAEAAPRQLVLGIKLNSFRVTLRGKLIFFAVEINVALVQIEPGVAGVKLDRQIEKVQGFGGCLRRFAQDQCFALIGPGVLVIGLNGLVVEFDGLLGLAGAKQSGSAGGPLDGAERSRVYGGGPFKIGDYRLVNLAGADQRVA